MEQYTGEIVNASESIKVHQDSIKQNKQLLEQSTDPREKISRERFISESAAEIASKKEKILNTIAEIYNWSENNGVLKDSKQFFQEFTRDYYGKEQNLETLLSMYRTV